jgi:hypothetical protein
MATRPAPLVVRWHALDLANVEAGAVQIATVEVENAGAARWRTRGPLDGLFLSYHWLDERGNPLFWDGIRTPLEHPVEPGEVLRHPLRLRGPIPPGRYRLSVDLVEESRFWLEDLGNAPLRRDVEVLPREATPPSEARSTCRRGSVARIPISSRTHRVVDATPRSPSRSSALRFCLRSSRTRKSAGCLRGGTTGLTASRGSTTRAPSSHFDRDLVVDATEDERA